jgi:lysozyme
MNNFQLGAGGIALIKEFEGCKLAAYKCPADIWTIGYGHTGPDVYAGLVISQVQADSLLRLDTQKFADAVNKLAVVKINQNQFDALVSLCYNIGQGAFGKSTLVRKLNVSDYRGAAEQFRVWNKGGGRVLQGLVRRRAAETVLFNKAVTGTAPTHDTPIASVATPQSAVVDNNQPTVFYSNKDGECLIVRFRGHQYTIDVEDYDG